MKQKSKVGFSLFKLHVQGAVFLGLIASLAVFAGAERSNEFRDGSVPSHRLHSSTAVAQSFMELTRDGALVGYDVESKVTSAGRRPSESGVIRPSGNTLWMVDDKNAIADGIAVDANSVWGAWTLSGARSS